MTGDRLTTAWCMSGMSTSIPNTAVPVAFSRLSMRGNSLPMYLNCDSDFRGVLSGSGKACAVSTNAP